jgi:hypothetical protein
VADCTPNARVYPFPHYLGAYLCLYAGACTYIHIDLFEWLWHLVRPVENGIALGMLHPLDVPW